MRWPARGRAGRGRIEFRRTSPPSPLPEAGRGSRSFFPSPLRGGVRGGVLYSVNQIKRLANRGQHPQRQAIDFQNSQGIEIVLVPFDDGAIGHGGVFDRHQFAQRAVRDHHPADLLRQVPWKAEQLLELQSEAFADVAED